MATVPYVFKRTPKFKKMFDDLSIDDQKLAREKFKIFKANPFDPSLNTHKINRLTSIMGTTVRAVEIKGNLRAVFTKKDNIITSFGIGTHDIYK
jgi:hypothetical protein